MVETKNTEKLFENAAQRFEDTWSTMYENNRKTVQSVMELQRNWITSSWEFFRTFQDEAYRMNETMVDQMLKFHKSAFKNTQDASSRIQEMTEKMVRENNDRFNESFDQSLEFVSTAAKKRRG